MCNTEELKPPKLEGCRTIYYRSCNSFLIPPIVREYQRIYVQGVKINNIPIKKESIFYKIFH